MVDLNALGHKLSGRRLSFTTRYVLLFGILLLLANSLLAAISLKQSQTTVRALIDKNMLDIVSSAAASLDGDALGALTKDDVDGPVFNHIKRQLLVFQNSTDIEFIYAVKQMDEDHYVFTVDPDPVDPGAFGEETLTTPALVQAAHGKPTVDSNPAADRWGNFYSAYAPVFDSTGKVAGIVGVDFDTQWYEDQITNNTRSLALISITSVILGGVVVALITRRVRTKFDELDAGLSDLSTDVDFLMDEMSSRPGFERSNSLAANAPTSDASDEIEALGTKIKGMQNELRLYLDHLKRQAYVDALTQVGSSTAYHETIDRINESIAAGTADFCIVVYDINSLKELNDTHGHACGDYYIQGAAQALVQGFGLPQVFRIGGDEFAVIAEGLVQADLDKNLSVVAAAVGAFNASSRYTATLSLSQGAARFEPETDTSYKDVFARADHAMYNDKREYYRALGSRYRRNDSDEG